MFMIVLESFFCLSVLPFAFDTSAYFPFEGS